MERNVDSVHTLMGLDIIFDITVPLGSIAISPETLHSLSFKTTTFVESDVSAALPEPK